MSRFLVLAALGLLAAVFPAQAQQPNQVANYYAGTPGTASYEHFSFWSHEGHRYNMQYSRGLNRNDAALSYAGPARLQGRSAFKVRFPGGQVLYVAPRGTALLVAPSATAAPTVFKWEYQGPVNGVGTVCSVCVADAAAARQLVQRYFVR